MPGYVKEALHKFQRSTQILTHNSSHQWNTPNYGSIEPQLAHQAPESPKLDPSEPNTVQQVVCNFLYYARAVNTEMLVVLNSITTEKTTAQKPPPKQ